VQLRELPPRHRQVQVVLDGLDEVLKGAAQQGIQLRTMGRGYGDDAAYFLAAAASGRHAAALCDLPA
jgi:hypothetical protein